MHAFVFLLCLLSSCLNFFCVVPASFLKLFVMVYAELAGTEFFCTLLDMALFLRKGALLYWWSANIQNRLHIKAVWLEPSLLTWVFYGALSVHRGKCWWHVTCWTDAQAYLCLHCLDNFQRQWGTYRYMIRFRHGSHLERK